MRAEQSRYTGLDILKAMSAFFVVCIHAPFPGTVGTYFTALTRIAVPIFFMLTGFFFADVQRKGNEHKQIKKIMILFIGSNFLYFIWKLLLSIKDNTVYDYFESVFSISSVGKFVVLNISPFSSHLWYLGAVLYILIIVAILEKLATRYQKKILYVVTPFLLIGDLILGKYSLLLLGREFHYVFVRNFLFVGLPYFSIGCFLREKKSQIYISRIALWSLAVVFLFTTLLERHFLVSIQANATRDHYISTTLLAVVMFIIFMDESWNHREFESIKQIGRDYSTWIYIIHPIVITILGAVASKVGIENIYAYVRPMVVYGISIIFIVFMTYLVQKVKTAAMYKT